MRWSLWSRDHTLGTTRLDQEEEEGWARRQGRFVQRCGGVKKQQVFREQRAILGGLNMVGCQVQLMVDSCPKSGVWT